MTKEVPLELSLPIGVHSSIDSIIEQAQSAEELGYDLVSVREALGRDAVTLLAAISCNTNEINIANSVFSVYSRSPALIGQSAVTLQRLSTRRFRVGIGVSTPEIVENWHGMQFDRPLRRLRETIEIIRGIFSGEPLEYHGEIFDLDGPSLRCALPETRPPLDVGALGPKATELAGRFADGWVPHFFTPGGFSERLTDLERGITLGDRNPEKIRVTFTLRCYTHQESHSARKRARRDLAYTIGAHGPYYRQSLAKQGYEKVTREVHEAWKENDRERATELITDELLDKLVAAGTPRETRTKVEEFADIDGVDAIRVVLGNEDIDNVYRTMETLAPQ